MDWPSFSIGALVSLVVFLLIEAMRNPLDSINNDQFRDVITAADARYLKLHRRHFALKNAVEKFRTSVDAQDSTAIAAASIEIDKILTDEVEPSQWPGHF